MYFSHEPVGKLFMCSLQLEHLNRSNSWVFKSKETSHNELLNNDFWLKLRICSFYCSLISCFANHGPFTESCMHALEVSVNVSCKGQEVVQMGRAAIKFCLNAAMTVQNIVGHRRIDVQNLVVAKYVLSKPCEDDIESFVVIIYSIALVMLDYIIRITNLNTFPCTSVIR